MRHVCAEGLSLSLQPVITKTAAAKSLFLCQQLLRRRAKTPHRCAFSIHGHCRRLQCAYTKCPAKRTYIPRGSISHRCVLILASADAASNFPDNAGSAQEVSVSQRLLSFQRAFWKFLRPHTIRGTILGSIAVTARALIESPVPIDWSLLPRAMLGVLALLCGNGFIVGINQIYDVDIDSVNKPFLPVAAGELSPALAWFLVVGLAVAGVAISAKNFGPAITKLYTLGLTLGTIYSVPPFRLKRFAIPAFIIIAIVRGFLLNFGVYSATRAALGLQFVWSPAILFITSFVTVFATVIAITKDLADVEGDLKYNIETFATQLGVRGVAFLGSGLLIGNYAAAILLAVKLPWAFRVPLMVGSHVLLAIGIMYATLQLEAANYSRQSIQTYYQFVWNVFYAEYCLLPFL